MAELRLPMLLLILIPVCAAVKVTLLTPSKNSTLDVAIIITPGADIDGLAYKPLGQMWIALLHDFIFNTPNPASLELGFNQAPTDLKAAKSALFDSVVLGETIQNSFHGRMWIALLHGFIFNTPNPASLELGFNQAVTDLKVAGFQGDYIYLAGHGLGGVLVSKFGQTHGDQLAGVMLFASYLTRGKKLRDYPVPLLTLSGDVDGLTRVTRIVDTFEELENETIHNPSPMSLMYTRAVIVERGLNHGCFASGTMPPRVRQHDLPLDDDVTLASAHQTITWRVIDFIVVNLRKPNEDFLTAVAWMKVGFWNTRITVRPLSAMKAMDINTNSTSNTTTLMQSALLGDTLSSRVNVSNSEIPEDIIAFYEPDVTVSGTTAHVQTFASVAMPFNPDDDSLNPQTPSELAAVMKTRAEMVAILKNENIGESNNTCRELNKFILDFAMNASSEVARTRWQKRGSHSILFLDDIPVDTPVQWVTRGLDLQYGSKGELTVTSYSHVTSVEANPLSKTSGVQYCKLLSPYRAMEWIYIDSLFRSRHANI